MKHKFFSIYGKVFSYTLLILIFAICVTGVFFANQIQSVIEATQRQQIGEVFQPLVKELEGKSLDEIIKAANSFHRRNTSFEFCFITEKGEIVYKTEGFIMFENSNETVRFKRHDLSPDDNMFTDGRTRIMAFGSGDDGQIKFVMPLLDGSRLYVSGPVSGLEVYNEFFGTTVIVISIILLISIIAAAIFARRIAGPIKKIAADTKRMSDLQPVPPPALSKDEIGQLAGDVYKMYGALKKTIGQLEIEIKRVKEMEENQRYFFSAASHELKTPIAATSALLEGMLDNMIEVSDYPRYLRECLKIMTEQSKLVSEILEIISVNNDTITLQKTQVNLKEMFSGVLPTYQAVADTKEQSIDIDIPGNLTCTLDTVLFGKVLSNVVMNAIQNTQNKCRIRIWAKEKDDKTVRLCVLNMDTRIDEEILSKIFEPFYREDKARSRGHGRSGLGLTLVKKALDIMEISFSLENTEEGVLFWMDLPH